MVFGVILDEEAAEGVTSILSLLLFVPWIAVTCRRLHDTGKSGWWQLIAIIPIIGFIVMIVWTVRAGDPSVNVYGQPPA
jgi:uncharacterized membrane protein YhaH (DUF805 family)